MLSLLGYTVWVEMDGSPMQEFQTKMDESARTVECWISSKAGKNFSIKITHDHAECDTLDIVFIDGSEVCRRAIYANCPGRPHTTTIDSLHLLENGSWTQRAFQFSAITTTDDDAYSPHDVPKDLGSIRITMERVHVGRDDPSKKFSTGRTATAHDIVHEKAKKIATHCVTFGYSKPLNTTSCTIDRDHDEADPKPFVTFAFRYRPADFLQANGIMSRPVKRKHSEQKDTSVDADTRDEDILEMQSQISDMREKLAKVEQELARKQARKAKKIKIEEVDVDSKSKAGILCKPRTNTAPGLEESEIIDLT